MQTTHKKSNLPIIYYLHPQISWKQFKWIQEQAYKGTGPQIIPIHMDRILWKALRARELNIGFNPKNKTDPIFITVRNIPKIAKIIK